MLCIILGSYSFESFQIEKAGPMEGPAWGYYETYLLLFNNLFSL